MGFEFTPEMWGMTSVATCFGGWIFGNLYAATRKNAEGSRAENGHIESGVAAEELDSLFSLRLTPKIAPNTESKTTEDKSAVAHTDGAQKMPALLQASPAQAGPAQVLPVLLHSAAPLGRRSVGEVALADERTNSEPLCPDHADTLPLSEIRAHARHLLQTQNVWEAPETQDQVAEFMRNADRRSVKLLDHYLGSIEELQRANDRKTNLRPIVDC